MSVTISTCNQICSAPTNSSHSKMLYSFAKQSRFLRREPQTYPSLHLALRSSMNSRPRLPPALLALAMAANMILLRNCRRVRRLIPIALLMDVLKRRDSLLGKVGRIWSSLGLSLPLSLIKTQGLAITRSIANAPKSRIRSQGKYSKKTKNRSAFQGRANTALLFPSAKTGSTSMPNTKTAACQISAECWDVAKQQRKSCQGQPATMCPRTKLYRPRGGTACPARRTARPEVSGPRREEKSP